MEFYENNTKISLWFFKNKNKFLKRIIGDSNESPIRLIKSTIPKENGERLNLHLSEFSTDLGEKIIEKWSDEGDKVFDPFAGRGRMFITYSLNRFYYGCEVSPKTYNFLIEKINKQNRLFNKYKINLYNIDSKKSNFDDNSFDLIFSCPPYWNIEKYEDVEGQLSNYNNYKDFLFNYEEIIKKCYGYLKKDKFAVFVVADFRKDGYLIPFHSDNINIFEKCGFKLWDIIIVMYKPINLGFGRAQAIEYKRTIKSHEYILVFKK